MKMCGFVQNIFVITLVIGFVGRMALGFPKPYPSCRTRDTCIRLTECRPYMNLLRSLRRPLSSAAVIFLRRQECGFDGTVPMVCCFPDNPKPLQVKRNLSFKGDCTESASKPEPEKKMQLPDRPQFIVNDLSEYSLTNHGSPSDFPVQSKEKTTTTQKPSKNRVKYIWSLQDFLHPATTTTKSPKPKNENDLKKKMEAFNQSFAYSAMDDFFFRRMFNKNDQNASR